MNGMISGSCGNPAASDLRGAMRGRDPHPPLYSRYMEQYGACWRSGWITGQGETCQETGKPCAMHGCPKLAREGKGDSL